MALPNEDERAGHLTEVSSAFGEKQTFPVASAGRRRSIFTNILTFAAIPSLLFWAMVIMLIEGNLVGAAQLVCVAISAGYVGWNLK